MERDLLTEADVRQIKESGISPDTVRAQIDFLKRGSAPIRLNRPCIVGDGIVVLNEKEQRKMVALHGEAARAGRFTKFVPASGAASRMFSHWHSVLTSAGFDGTEMAGRFAENLRTLAFFRDLADVISRRGEDIAALLEERKLRHILSYILTSRGLNYGQLPKSLLKFHTYDDGSRTAIEEHLVEAALYTADTQNTCRIHFTVSEEHLKRTERFLKKIKGSYEKKLGVTFQIGLSSQRSSSNTVALEGEGLYRDNTGRLILRPGGHGALLENLNDLGGDIIFIKNIDNVVPDRLKPVTVFFKKVLAGYLISLQKEIFGHLETLTKGNVADNAFNEVKLFCRNKLHIAFSSEFEAFSPAKQRSIVVTKLNRPLRVCGMVKNEGEPGGGPFWVDEDNGGQCLQIVEYQQIDATREDQRNIWTAASHFNPVDIVCGVKDYRSRKFDLSQFSDRTAVTLSEKNEKGRHIKVLEQPGLWNGSMSRWITVFVEVPIETFNPVKNIDDLLRPQHLFEEV